MKSIKLNALAYMGIRVLNIIFPILTGTYVARVLDRTDLVISTQLIPSYLSSYPSQPMVFIIMVFVQLVM